MHWTLHGLKLDGILVLIREVDVRCHSEKLSNWQMLGKENIVLSSGISAGIFTTLQGKPHAQK